MIVATNLLKLGYLCDIMRKNVSVILTGSCSPEYLEKVLLGYNAQNYRNFEVLLALNDKQFDTLKVSDTLQKELFFPVSVMEMTDGILNQALFTTATTEYFLFANIAAIPRYDFVEQHVKYREEGYFLSGSSNVVSEEVFQHLNRETVYSGVCFTLKWLKQHNTKGQVSDVFRFSEGLQGTFLNRLFCANTVFNLENASVWRKDLEHVLMQSKVSDDITKLLTELGCKPKQLKFSTVLLKPDAVPQPR